MHFVKMGNIQRVFYVGSITNFVRANNQAALYVMKLITPEQMMNSLLLVSRAYDGTLDTAIEKITKDYYIPS